MINDKADLREKFRNVRLNSDVKLRHQAARHLVSFLGEGKGKVIALYVARDGEVPVNFYNDELERNGWRLALPKVSKKNTKMDFLEWDGAFAAHNDIVNIPIARGAKVRPDVVIVPLISFDSKGHRLGMGGGYYDRTLEIYKNARKIGVAIREQRFDLLPSEPHDVPLDMIITETEIIDFK